MAASRTGVADLLLCVGGFFLAMEVKRPGKKPTPMQKENSRQVHAAGGFSVVVTSLEEAQEAIGVVRSSVHVTKRLTSNV